jgi:uncharacterized Zn-binding protein involved in type VI secretion
MHFCPLGTPADHIGGPVLPRGGPQTVINGKPAARVGDKADCKVALDDTVRGGTMTIFVDGMPASRIHDPTDIGLIMEGSPDVMLGESGGGPLTPFQAEWLYNYLDKQRDAIPFEYAQNGCEARADRMCELIDSLGIPVEKQWLRATRASGQLAVAIPKHPRGEVKWNWHVAPVIAVALPGGPQKKVIDPSLGFQKPVTIQAWIEKQTTRPAETVTGATPKEVYRRAWDTSSECWVDARNLLRNSMDTHHHLNGYREERAKPIEEGGRNIPNKRVHF